MNKLSLNLTKTNFMIFHPRQKKVNVNVPLTLENTVIKQVMETKFLGVLIDQHLSWKPHIDFVSKKISKSVEIIAKALFYLLIPNFDDLILLPCIYIYPFLTYCNAPGARFSNVPVTFRARIQTDSNRNIKNKSAGPG